MEVSGEPHAQAASPPRRSLRYPLNWLLGGRQSPSGRFGQEKSPLLLPGIESQSVICSTRNLVNVYRVLSEEYGPFSR
jgi:hypothetical protein